MKFEAGLEKIDLIIEQLENGEIELEKSLEKYEEAMKVLAECKKILNNVEGKLKKVVSNENGKIEITDFE